MSPAIASVPSTAMSTRARNDPALHLDADGCAIAGDRRARYADYRAGAGPDRHAAHPELFGDLAGEPISRTHRTWV
jgi:hypothetical protein